MTFNLGAVPQAGIRQTDPARDMDAFDALPKSLRDRLNDAPFQMSAEYVLEKAQGFGVRIAVLEYETDCAKLNGGKPWVPLTAKRR